MSPFVAAILSVDDDAWFDRHMAARASRKAKDTAKTEVPGLVFVQLDGLAKSVLERAVRSGDVPTLARWIRTQTDPKVKLH